jgi:quinol monooxygenase YgiN
VIIVTGAFTLDPADRDQFVAGMAARLQSTRAEPGCLEYVVAADPADPARAVLLEKWESEDALAAHAEALKSSPPSPGGPRPTAMTILRYDATGERPLM